MFTLFRAILYASGFIALLLIYVPMQVAERAGISYPEAQGVPQIAGLAIGTIGALIALWCVLTFTLVGKGTPAPFDPPRELVTTGPYRFLRNPMYAGASLALAGASLYFQSLALLGYTAVFLTLTHLLAVLYEEPTLKRLFGAAYTNYFQQTKRWGIF